MATAPRIQIENDEDVESDVGNLESWVENRCSQVLRNAFIRRIDHSGLLFGSVPLQVQRPTIDSNMLVPDGTGQTLLHAAIVHINDKAKLGSYVTALLEFNGDLNAMDYSGLTPFMCAASSKHVSSELFRLMMNQPSLLLNAQDFRGRTALMHAVEGDRPNFVKLMADLFMKRNQFSFFLVRNDHGETAEDVARRLEKRECERILCKRRLKLLEQIQKQLKEKYPEDGLPVNPVAQITYAHKATTRWKKFAEKHQTDGGAAATGGRMSVSEIRINDFFPSGSRRSSDAPSTTRERSVSFDIRKLRRPSSNQSTSSNQVVSQERIHEALHEALLFAVNLSKSLAQSGI